MRTKRKTPPEVIKVGSLNINGGILSKVDDIVEMMKKYQLDVLGLQELKYNNKSDLSKRIKDKFLGHGMHYYDSPSIDGRFGTALVVKRCKKVHSVIAQNPQITGVRLVVNKGQTKTFINIYTVYGDAQHDGENTNYLIEQIESLLVNTNQPDQLCLIGGDWNAIINKEDSTDPDRGINEKIVQMMERQGLVDIEKTVDPNGYCKYTYPVNGRRCHKSRLDYFLGNSSVLSAHTNVRNDVTYRSKRDKRRVELEQVKMIVISKKPKMKEENG